MEEFIHRENLALFKKHLTEPHSGIPPGWAALLSYRYPARI